MYCQRKQQQKRVIDVFSFCGFQLQGKWEKKEDNEAFAFVKCLEECAINVRKLLDQYLSIYKVLNLLQGPQGYLKYIVKWL